MKLLNQNQTVKYVAEQGRQISRQAINKWTKETPLPAFFILQDGKYLIDIEHDSFKRRINSPARIKKREDRQKNKTEKIETENFTEDSNYDDLAKKAYIAEMQDKIFAAKIKEEKAKQEEIKTAELKKELAPIYLLKHFYSFAEKIIQRGYRRFEELSPELEALYLAGKSKEAVKLLLREQEGINHMCVSELQKAIKEEGYEDNEL